MALCDHPNVCKLHDAYGDGEKGSAIVIEYLPGKSLFDYIKEKYPVSIPREVALDWMNQMAEAVNHLHSEAGICHRDLHPGNWMVSEDGKKVTLIDFGTALVVGVGNLLPKTWVFPCFASPEIIARVPSSFDSDVWYLGMVFYGMCHP